MPLASPTPKTAPTRVCVVDTGIPVPEAITTVVAAAISAANPRLGVSSVIFFPMVLITLWPHIASPVTIPKPPRSNIHTGSADSASNAPLFAITLFIAANGPIALATSFDPWAKAIEQAVKIINTPNTRSTLCICAVGWSESGNLSLRNKKIPMVTVRSANARARKALWLNVTSRPTWLKPFTSVTIAITKPTRNI